MELSQLVNAGSDERDLRDPNAALRDSVAPAGLSPAVKTPCLYIGPAGQRCDRPARADGFCSKHQQNASDSNEVPSSTIAKRALAVIGVIAALWPLIIDLVRELLRLLR
jgi:Family of unknown function (DUF5763)